MEGPRQPMKEEFHKVLQFLNQELRPTSGWSINNEYPTALTTSNIHNMRIITDESEILSHAVIKPLIVKTPFAAFKVAAIGSVVTQEKHRNLGYSQQIIADCLKEAETQSCDLAILWTNLYDFYRKMNFELAGYEISFLIDHDPSIKRSSAHFIKGRQISAESIFRLYSQHTVNTYRTLSDFEEFLSIPKTEVYSLWSTDNKLLAYAIVGKGEDLTGYIHEWGGSVSSILELLTYIFQERAPLTIILPHHSINLISALEAQGYVKKTGYLGMMKIVSPEKLFYKIKKAARAVGIPNLTLEKRADGYLFGFHEQILIPDEKALVQLLFGPTPVMTELGNETIQLMEKLFPIPFWLWGWDSI